MIAYEIQLRYVIRDKIRDKIQSKTKSSLRIIIFYEKENFVRKKIAEKNCLGHCLTFPVLCLSCLRQIDVYHHQVAKKYRN